MTLAVVVAAVTGASMPLNAAVAASAEPSTVEVARTSLTATRIDQAIANQHGYKVVVRNGALDSVKVADHPITQDPVITPLDAPVVYGNCGVSFLYYARSAPRKAIVHTGFDLNTVPPSVLGSWTVAVTDNAGVGSRTWTPSVGWSWDTTWDTTHSVGGYSVAQVTNGYVVLADGRVCVSGNPWQHTYL
ncbi:hypothetical protein [Plantactinospora sp. DSM 117369]